MAMRELPFGAWLSESFIKKLKWESVKAIDESAGVLPCLCVEERQHYEAVGATKSRAKRTAFEEGADIPPVNRLAQPKPQFRMLIKERIWVLQFNKHRYSKRARFEIDGLELHISEEAQIELRGATIRVVNDKIVVSYERKEPAD